MKYESRFGKILEFRNKIIQEFNSTLGISFKYLNNFRDSKQIKLFKRLPRKLKKKLKKHEIYKRKCT